MAVTAIMPLVSVGSSTPIIDMASTSGGIDRNTSVMPHQDIFDPAAEIAGDQADRDADRHGDRQHHDAEDQRDAVGVDDAGEEIAADEVGAHDVGPLRRLVEIGEIDDGAGMRPGTA